MILIEKQTNQLGIRSKEMLTEAFFELLAENPYRKIRIKELTERARVSRPTFYAHYESIDAIPRNYFSENWLADQVELFEQIGEENLPLDEISHLSTTRCFAFYGELAALHTQLKMANMESVIQEAMRDGFDAVFDMVEGFVLPDDPLLKRFLLSHLTNAVYNIYDLWVETGMKQTPEEMSEMLNILIDFQGVTENLIARFEKR